MILCFSIKCISNLAYYNQKNKAYSRRMKNTFSLFIIFVLFISENIYAESCSSPPIFQLQNMAKRQAQSLWIPKVSFAYQYRNGGNNHIDDLHDEAVFSEHIKHDIQAGHRFFVTAHWDLDKVLSFFSTDENLRQQSQHYMNLMWQNRYYVQKQQQHSLEHLVAGKISKVEFMRAAKRQLQHEFLFENCTSGPI